MKVKNLQVHINSDTKYNSFITILQFLPQVQTPTKFYKFNFKEDMQSKNKQILLLGSGLMAESVSRQLLNNPNNSMTIASDIEQQAKALSEKLGKDRCSYSKVNISDSASLGPLVDKADIVVSYVPAFLHIYAAKLCLQKGKHLVTASYVTPQMKALHEEAQKKGLIFLNELGLDPGIDHLATMKIVDEVEKQGGKIIAYESWCGGLPSPTDCDNPLGYKFTWAPIGAFRALNNKATYLQNNESHEIEPLDLLYHKKTITLNQALELQGYPNRNSIPYKQLYGLKDASKVLRGTLRYKGFCTIINAMKEIGINAEIPVKGSNWNQHVLALLGDQQGETIEAKIESRCIKKPQHYQKLSDEEKKDNLKKILIAFKFFGILSSQNKIHDETISSLENLIKLLEPKLNLKEGQTDMIAMQHLFTIIDKDGKKTLKKSTLIQIGQKKGFSAMSTTVGTPTAIGAQLILDGKISKKGVLIPIYPEIYNPILEKLAQAGIKLVDTEEQL